MTYHKICLEIRFKKVNIFKEILREYLNSLNKIDTNHCTAYNQTHLKPIEELPIEELPM
jgi:hypothetical protein